MAARAGQSGPRLLLFLGGTLAALAGAFTGMGVPNAPEPRLAGKPEEPPRPSVVPVLTCGKAPACGNRMRPPNPAQEALPGPLLAGRLTGPSGPVAQAPVALVPLPRPDRPDRARLIQLTGLDGSYCFALPHESGTCWALHFQVPGFGLHARPVHATNLFEEVHLAYGRWIPGRVCTRDGRPLPGTRVLVGLPLTTPEGPRVLWTDSGLAGPEGSFVARDLPPGERVFLLGEHPECAPAMPLEIWAPAGGPADELVLVLPAGKELEGQVVRRSGAEAPRVRIGWETVHGGGLKVRRDAVTRQDGRFTLRGLPHEGPAWVLELSGPEGQSRKVSLEAGPWPGGVRLELPW